MKYFTIQELSHSDTAVARGIDNCPTAEAIHNLTKLVENVLDPLREKHGKPIRGKFRLSKRYPQPER